MASSRIPFSEATPLGSKLRLAIANGVECRKILEELNRIVNDYVDDNAGIAVDSGIDPASVPLFRNLLNQSQAELCSNTVTAVAQGGVTGICQIFNAMG